MEEQERHGLQVMAKPAGAKCNLNCEYCFYLEKENILENTQDSFMDSRVLEAYIKKYIEENNTDYIPFVWQGGEPMLAGIGFYQNVIRYQEKYRGDKKVGNVIQTNGILIDEDWCVFFSRHHFTVGISLDGPPHLNDRYRKDKNGQGTGARALHAIHLLERYGIEFNVLVSVSDQNSRHPMDVYRFLKEEGVRYIQFTPIVEREPETSESEVSLRHAGPGSGSGKLMPFTVKSEDYGEFLTEVFDEWVKHDVGSVFVMNFEWALSSWLGLESTMCIFARECGQCAVIEKNGDIYACDHYVYPEYRIGNIQKDSLMALAGSREQRCFGREKAERLSQRCRSCEVLFACHGECPRHRFEADSKGEPVSYLCAGYKKYFVHIHPYMKAMVQMIKNDIPVDAIMTLDQNPVAVVV